MDAVIFDLWKTLIKPGSKTFTQGIADALEMDEDYVRDYIRSSSSRNKNIGYKQIVQEIWSFTHDRSMGRDIQHRVDSTYKQFVADAKFIHGAEECLETLREKGYRVGIVSNSTSVSIAVTDALRLREKVDGIYISCVTGFLKPDPRAFHHVAKEWNLFPNQVLVVGDKLTTDVLGAKLAKMNVVWYAPNVVVKKTTIPVDIAGIISDLSEVVNIVEEQGGRA